MIRYVYHNVTSYIRISRYASSEVAITGRKRSEREKKIDRHIDRYIYIVTHTDEVASWMYMKSQESDTILTYG